MDERLIAETSPEVIESSKPRRVKITEQVFLEALLEKTNADLVNNLRSFLDKVREQPKLSIVFGDATLMIKSEDEKFTLARFEKDGDASFYGVAYSAERAEHLEIGEKYLIKVSSLIGNSTLNKSSLKTWNWEIKKNNKKLEISDCLKIQDKWLTLMQEAVEELEQAKDRDFST